MDNPAVQQLLDVLNDVNLKGDIHIDFFLEEARNTGDFFSEKLGHIEFSGEIPGEGYQAWHLTYADFFNQKISNLIEMIFDSYDQKDIQDLNKVEFYTSYIKVVHTLQYHNSTLQTKLNSKHYSEEQILIAKHLVQSIQNLLKYIVDSISLIEKFKNIDEIEEVRNDLKDYNPKIKLNLSVPEIASLLRLAYETNIVDHNLPKTKIFEGISEAFLSIDESSQCSPNTIRNFFYSFIRNKKVDTDIVADIQAILQKMQFYIGQKM